ncbi:MAG: hypothetical protein QM683_10780 [Lacrimispora sp.]
MLGIGKGLLSGYKPRRTLVFCAGGGGMGHMDCKYDWSTGAWQQVSVHRSGPER